MAKTGMPLGVRQQIINDIVDIALKSNLDDGSEANSMWTILRRIFADDRPNYPWSTKSRSAIVRTIKRSNEELYNTIQPWITIPEKVEED